MASLLGAFDGALAVPSKRFDGASVGFVGFLMVQLFIFCYLWTRVG